jgi:Zn-finger nucleic acid-binding protein
MKCPNDAATLVMSERSGVEIDYCPECRGVWLDRGELDKILDRAASEFAPGAPAPAQQQAPVLPEPDYRSRYSEPFPESRGDRRDDDRPYDRSYGGYGDRNGQGQYRRKRKESWLSELFD